MSNPPPFVFFSFRWQGRQGLQRRERKLGGLGGLHGDVAQGEAKFFDRSVGRWKNVVGRLGGDWNHGIFLVNLW